MKHNFLNDSYIEIVMTRLQLLRPPEKALIEAFLYNNVSLRNLAMLSNRPQSTISRQIKRIIFRLVHGEYIYFARYKHLFSRTEQNIAYNMLILGRGYRTIAASLNASPYQVRKTITRIKLHIHRAKTNPQSVTSTH